MVWVESLTSTPAASWGAPGVGATRDRKHKLRKNHESNTHQRNPHARERYAARCGSRDRHGRLRAQDRDWKLRAVGYPEHLHRGREADHQGDAPQLPDGKGHKVYILAGIGKNGKPCGLKVAEDTYQGKTSIIVSANENATVTFDEPEALAGTEESAPATRSHPASEPASEPEMPDDVPMSYPPTQQQAQPVAHSTATKPTAAVPVTPTAPPVTRGGGARDTRSAWAQVDTGLNKLRRLRLRTLACAIRIAEDMANSGHAISPDHTSKIDSWIAIECCRNGLLAHVPDCDPPNITGE